jgi:hypothetical protein
MICIAGTAQTRFGRVDEDVGALAGSCCGDLLHAASVEIRDVDASYISNFSSHFCKQCHLSALLSS